MENVANTNEIMNNTELNATKRTDIYQIDPRNIVVVDGFNARQNFDVEELKGQIRLQGVLNPLTVVPFKDKDNKEKYRLVDGERRYRAVMELLAEGEDIRRVKALYLPKNTKEEDMYIQQMMRNEGKRFSEAEMAILFNTFKEKYGYTQTEIADKFGKKTSFVSRCLALLDLPAEVWQQILDGAISADTARAIVAQAKDDEQAQIDAVDKAVKDAKAKGKKTATTKDIAPTMQAAKLIVNMRKEMKKLTAILDGIDNEQAKTMMEYFQTLHSQTEGFDDMVKTFTEDAPKEDNAPKVEAA